MSEETALVVPDAQTLATMPEPETVALALIERGRAALAEVETLERAESIFGQTKILEAATRVLDLNKETIANAQELCVRAERRIGQLSPPAPRAERGQGRKESPADPAGDSGAKPERDVPKEKRAARARKLANVPDETFEQAVEETKARALDGGGNLTSETVLRKTRPNHKVNDERAKRKRLRDKFDERVKTMLRDSRQMEKDVAIIRVSASSAELDDWAASLSQVLEKLQGIRGVLLEGEE